MALQEWSDGIWVASPGDEAEFSEDLRALAHRAHTAGTVNALVVDLSGLTRINASGLSMLLRLYGAARRRETTLTLAGASAAVRAVFAATGLDRLFEFARDLPTALAGSQLQCA